ncbi:hypothetical protein FOZG_15003 [Fusarium oxysporum Fo47]|uniref:Uncharacterized protein n=1 Tax=Fusarium oxysporum Fo47 TaxID=660027 RepID=W9JIW8_FUSOX|nr:hypothetical protein FOZG_15003 [Fusarium oxysporum Fo47]
MLHGSRYWRLSVAHPGSVNLDVGAPTALYACDGGMRSGTAQIPGRLRYVVLSP